MTDYQYKAQAKSFLSRHGLRFSSIFCADKCPPYCDDKHTHGDCYRVTIRRKTGGQVSFDFWNGVKDQQSGATTIDAYDALSCISSEASIPDTFEDFCGDMGYDTDSRKAHDLFKRCDRFAKRLRAFFTEAELQELAEIQ